MIACNDPRFRQSVQREAGWALINPDKKSGELLYRHEQTGEEVLVPSIWYNQPVEWRIEMALFRAERAETNAARLRLSHDRWAKHQAEDMERGAREQRAQAAEMKRTGIPGP